VKVRVLDRAERDLEDAAAFYERQGAGLGGYFFESLDADIASLAYSGGVHRKVHGQHQLLAKKFPYAVYYETDGDTVLVNAVIDCRRAPAWIRDRVGSP
jgi:plasmid stabilization system protein ParE